MALYSDNLIDERNGLPIEGANLWVYDNLGVEATLTDALDQPLTQPLVTDSDGGFEYKADDGLYRHDFWKNSVMIFRDNRVIVGTPATVTASLGAFGTTLIGNATAADARADLDVYSITQLVASAGSSLIGHVQSGTGAVATTVQAVLRRTINVEDFGPDGTQAGDSAAIKAAITAAAGRPIVFQPKRYYWDGTTIAATSVKFYGGGMPSVNSARTALEGVGTIIQGSLVFTGTGIELRDLGVDHGSSAYGVGGDAIKISPATYNAGRLAVLQNVAGLGRNATDAFHSILVEGYETASLNNCIGAVNQFCFAIKSRNINIDGIRAINGQNLIILKSDGSGAGAGSLASVNLNNMVGEGSADTDYGVRVLSDNVSIASLNISNINLNGVDYAMLIEAGAATAISEMNVSNFNAKDVRLFGIQTGGAGGMYNFNFNNINLIDLQSRAAQFQGGIINMANVYCSMKAGSTTQAADFFRVESSTTSFRAYNLTLVENYGAGSTVPTLLLGLGRSLTKIKDFTGNIEGNTPLYGFSSQVLSGATNTLTPVIDLDKGRSLVKVTAAGAVEIININSTLAGSTKLPEGYQVDVLTASAQNFTFKTNSDLRNVSGDVVINNNLTISYVWGGTSWHEMR